MLLKPLLAVLVFAFLALQGQTPPEEHQKVIAVLYKSAQDWNRGDLAAFAESYKNGPDTEIVGPTNVYGFDAILALYRKHYANRAAMGQLSFSDEDVRDLDGRFATVTARFHLVRSAEGGGNEDGYFLLVMEKTAAGWRIVRDASFSLPQQPAK